MSHFSSASKDSQDLNKLVNSRKQKSFFNPILQPKLSINQPGDVYEQEADAMADKVMRMPDPAVSNNLFFKPAISSVQSKCAHCEEEEKLQRKPLLSFIQKKESTNGSSIISESASNQIQVSKGNGVSLSGSSKSFMENRFGVDFSNVNIHTNNNAAQLSNDLSAQAFTIGNDIYFNEGKYQPESFAGKHLLAHELTHTISCAVGI